MISFYEIQQRKNIVNLTQIYLTLFFDIATKDTNTQVSASETKVERKNYFFLVFVTICVCRSFLIDH
jgi:acetolactate synthase small subunit